ncbi:6892_t:CDS:2 [Paraglomus occultum]|uniref:6892_t:CDS:1 n=1 Tax=Paraglomus occultum TaxID=144539 RepID=A0A9N9APF5_9GLOM|nr:6892_t:CDS:2 [Paraglomus occultum]
MDADYSLGLIAFTMKYTRDFQEATEKEIGNAYEAYKVFYAKHHQDHPGTTTDCYAEYLQTLGKQDAGHHSKKARIDMISKDDLLRALKAFKDTEDCQHNSFREEEELRDENLIAAREPLAVIGNQLPFTGREDELEELRKCIDKNIELWRMRNVNLTNFSIRTEEQFKHSYRHPVVAGGPGRGKTALMTRGLMLVRSRLQEPHIWTNRAFAWDLQSSQLQAQELELLGDATLANVSGGQSVLASRILHQAVNGNRPYADFLAEFVIHLKTHGILLSDVTLDAVLDHVVQPAMTSSFSSLRLTTSTELKPLIVLFHISETNVLLPEQGPYTRIESLMKAVYEFNSSGRRCMIVLTFDGTHRAELLNAFEVSGIRCEMITLRRTKAETYAQILQALVKKAVASNLIRDKDLQTFSPPEQLKIAFAACGDNIRLFSLLIYEIGRYDTTIRKLNWIKFFENLCKRSSDISIVAKWMNGVGDLVRKHYKKYTEALFNLDSRQMLRVIAPALLGSEFDDTPKTLVLGSIYTWEMLEKYGAISLYGPRRSRVEMPYMLLQVYLDEFVQTNDSIIKFIHSLNELTGESHFRQNEKCDIAVIVLQLFQWHFNKPNYTRLRLKDLFPTLEGIAAYTYVNLPDAIQNVSHLDHWPKILARHFDPQKDLEEGAYVGAGNDEFADSWVVFRREDKKGVVVLAIESKRRATTERLTAEYFNAHKEKVKKKLPKGTLYVFVMVADMRGENVTADNDEMIICKENMEELYGNWLAQCRHFSLVFDKRTK